MAIPIVPMYELSFPHRQCFAIDQVVLCQNLIQHDRNYFPALFPRILEKLTGYDYLFFGKGK